MPMSYSRISVSGKANKVTDKKDFLASHLQKGKLNWNTGSHFYCLPPPKSFTELVRNE